MIQQAYDRVFSAFKLPKETDEEKAIRSEAIQKETKYAAQVPMEVARTVHSILPMIDVVARKGNSNAVTDACVSMMCARTAILGALLNVRINLTSIKDEKIRQRDERRGRYDRTDDHCRRTENTGLCENHVLIPTSAVKKRIRP